MTARPRKVRWPVETRPQAWYLILAAWFAAISILPDPRPLSAPEWIVAGFQSIFDISDAVARAITTVALRGIGFGLLGVFLACATVKRQPRWVTPIVLLAAPVLAITSQWINYRYFPILPQIQLSVIASVLGALIGLSLRRNLIALSVPVLASIGLFLWGTSTAVSTDLATAAQTTGRHVIAMASETPDGDEGFVALTKLAFAYAEDNSHGTDAVFANQAAILSLGIILGEERLARMAQRNVELHKVDQFAALRRRITLGNRHDLSRHFWVSAGLVVLTDANRSLTIGIGKEMMDSTPGGSGFSFVDMMANRAGIMLASSATRNQASAREIQLRFRDRLSSSDFLPDYKGLPEGLYRQEFQSEFGGLGGTKTREMNQEIARRLDTAKALHVRTR